MTPRPKSRRAFLPIAGVVALLLMTSPVLGAKPTDKPAKTPEISISLTGTVASTEDAKGRAAFSMTVAGVIWELSAGPKWFWGTNNPLAPFVGKTVEVTGTYHAGETDLDVDTVDGKTLRAPGKPPWAGGPKVVGQSHPGWKEGKLGKMGKGHGRDHAPGQLKDKAKAEPAA